MTALDLTSRPSAAPRHGNGFTADPSAGRRLGRQSSRRGGASATAAVALALLSLTVANRAQAEVLVSDGDWSVWWNGRCHLPPVLMLRGTGHVARPGLARAYAQTHGTAIFEAVAAQCPQARTAVLMTRDGRLELPIDAPNATPAVPAPAATPPAPDATSGAAASNPTAESGQGFPLPAGLGLTRVADATDAQGRCDAVLAWLRTGPPPDRGPIAGRLAIFRDSSLRAVFGKVYDEDGGGWREETYRTVISPCLGQRSPPPRRGSESMLNGVMGTLRRQVGPLAPPVRPERLPPETVRLVLPYASLLREALGGVSGPYRPEVVMPVVLKARAQEARARALLAQAEAGPADLAAFRALDPRSSGIDSLDLLAPTERQQLRDALVQRRTALAPAVLQAWLEQARGLPPGPESALRIQRELAQMADVVQLAPSATREAVETATTQLVGAGIGPPIADATAALREVPANRDGAHRLAAWEESFTRRFVGFEAEPAYRDALDRLDAERQRVLTALAPSWQAEIAAMPANAGAVRDKRAELAGLFGGSAGRQAALFERFQAPLAARDAQIRARIEAAEQAQLSAYRQSLATAAGKRGAPALREQDLNIPPGPLAELLRAIFEGHFERVGLQPSDTRIRLLVGGFTNRAWSRCGKRGIDDPVELPETVCREWLVTKVARGNEPAVEQSRICTQSETHGSGVYVERGMSQAMNADTEAQLSSGLRQVVDQVMQRPERGSSTTGKGSFDWLSSTLAYQAAGADLAAANDCDGRGVKRFERNLEHLLLGTPATQLDGLPRIGVAMLPPPSGEAYRDSNYERLLDDLVSDQSRGWAFDRYEAHSITDTSVSTRDKAGRPAVVIAAFGYQGMRGRQTGQVTLRFEDGRPRCITFSDQPDECRALSQSIVADYLDGAYR